MLGILVYFCDGMTEWELCCCRPALQEGIIAHVYVLLAWEKITIPNFEVQFLLTAYHFLTIIKFKKMINQVF
jgi:hypothetical protein